MSLPPVNLLLPQRFTFKDEFSDYPLHISSPTPGPLLTFLLLDHINKTQEDQDPHSILLNCYGTRSNFTESLTDQSTSSFSTFFTSEVSSKGKYLAASKCLDIIHVATLHELRAILYTLFESPPLVPVADVPDSQSSSDSGTRRRLPILAVSGMDVIHSDAGDVSAQSISRTLAALMDLSLYFEIVVHDSVPCSTEINVCSGPLPHGLQDQKTTLEVLYRRYMSYDWHLQGDEQEGSWRHFGTQNGYRVKWDEDLNGECRDVKVIRL